MQSDTPVDLQQYRNAFSCPNCGLIWQPHERAGLQALQVRSAIPRTEKPCLFCANLEAQRNIIHFPGAKETFDDH